MQSTTKVLCLFDYIWDQLYTALARAQSCYLWNDVTCILYRNITFRAFLLVNDRCM